jgi:hypothetical protein
VIRELSKQPDRSRAPRVDDAFPAAIRMLYSEPEGGQRRGAHTVFHSHLFPHARLPGVIVAGDTTEDFEVGPSLIHKSHKTSMKAT